jgi:hypothetical protein
MDDISIERLIFNLPGFDAGQAQELAQHVAKGLAATPLRCGNFGTLVVELNERAACSDVPRLANAIIESLREQIG